MLHDLFRKEKYATINISKAKERSKPPVSKKKEVDKKKSQDFNEELFVKCKKCGEPILKENMINDLYTCNKCDYHFRINARDRINLIVDKDSFIEYDKDLQSSNPLNFPEYQNKLDKAKNKSNEVEGVVTGEGKINGIKTVICVMEPNFMMGSMGCVVGEKITRAIENAVEKRFPLIIFSASGGARMQEGILSLMQMAKTSAALSRLSDEGLLYISVLTDPTTGGVTASFAMLGDIILAEPGALIGFAGPRVIEQTIRQKLPEGFQRSEFLKEKGFIDKIVHRRELKEMLYKILYIHTLGGGKDE
ncbi:acetyl-CoA carboxylase, carboxyltransferase subunit beta [Caldisalinibacter kiritimatiensis]|uniref:Acetyl-coenzyme A carboxylase carboxyl transferase subunit beta n=1 Tax=Caldisalinibacter kiritimatiensis TaxID=1304284 RepID=R1AWK4_9FIRM|nr:acetyl-CoA carboxylase, carboxyltransferase subunit beta [Caldisalinibacter kiritimatiensis]EOD00987.1 Acetyl-coenzyme A carboxyl transferase beta chain [Caldisalinibacter kiritimatiensis]